MRQYKLVANSRGKAPRFAITIGLAEGYGPTAKLHTVDEVVDLVEAHLKECAATGRPYLTGSVTTGVVVYAWPDGPGKSGGGREPQACYSGEKNPLYNSAMTAEQVADFLNGLASHLGAALGQTRIYVAYDGDMWVLQKEDAATPTGETVVAEEKGPPSIHQSTPQHCGVDMEEVASHYGGGYYRCHNCGHRTSG